MLCFYITLLYQIYFCTFFLLFMYVSYTKILGQSVTKSPYFHFQYISGLFASSDISHIFFHKNLQLSCPVDNNILLLHCLLLFFVVMKNSHFYKMLTKQFQKQVLSFLPFFQLKRYCHCSCKKHCHKLFLHI